MSHKFGNFLDEIFKVKFKKTIKNEFNYYQENGYIEYRVGCDLCGKGKSCGLKTNIIKFFKNNSFNLNELEIDFNNTWYTNDVLEFNLMYETSNKKIIEKIYNLYLKLCLLNEELTSNYKIKISSTHTENVGIVNITSTFCQDENNISYEELKNIKNVHICPDCFKLFILINESEYKKYFIKQNPLKYFWIDFVVTHLHDMIDFESETSKKSFYDKYIK